IIDYVIETEANLFSKGKDSWYSLYDNLIKPGFSNTVSNWVLRLYLDMDVLYKNRIRPQRIIEVLEEERILECVHSPIINIQNNVNGIIIDVYVKNIDSITKLSEFEKSNISNTEAVYFYFYNI